MIKPKDMVKVSVFGPKSMMKDTIAKMYDLNVVHIEDHIKKTDDEIFDIGEPFEENEKYAEVLVKIRTLISNLGIKMSEVEASTTEIDIIGSKVSKIYEDSLALIKRKEYFVSLLKIYEKKEIEKALSQLNLDEEDDFDYKNSAYFIGFVNNEYDLLSEELERITKKFTLNTTSYSGITLASIFIEDKKKDKLAKLLENQDFSPIDGPVIKAVLKTQSKPAVKFVKLNKEQEVAQNMLRKSLNRIEELKAEQAEFLLKSEKKLRIESEKSEAPLKFASTKNTFYVKGWVPAKNQKKLTDELNKVTKNKVHLDFQKPSKKDNVPIAFNHPKIVEPFEAFMDLYTLPSYKEIDPTFFMFLTFPIFFGLMLGDVGYGLVVLTLFLILKAKMPGAKNMINAFIIAAVCSIVFGAVFGEYFGYEEVSPAIGKMLNIHPEKIVHGDETEIIYPIPHLFSRSHGMSDLLSMSILFGLVHLFIGYVIGFVNVYKAHGFKHAFLEKVGWMMLFPAAIYIFADFLGVVTGFTKAMLSPLLFPVPVILGLSVLAIIIIIMGEGVRGVVELPALISNILSYARLMAVGLASLSLALVVNNLADEMFRSGIGGIIMGIVILVLGHTINIALGILSPFLHALRLHYVEFFSKFYHGGGRKYKPFGNE